MIRPAGGEDETTAMAQVTVFGGTGYLGREVVRQLAQAGTRRIRIAVRHPVPAGAAVGDDRIETVEADVTRPGSVRRALEGSDGAVNAVSLYLPTRTVGFEDIHVTGARNVASAAREVGAALVHVSGVGADAGSSQRYIRARGQGEQAVRAAHAGAVLVRPTVLFSAQGGLVEQVLRVLRRTRVFPLFGRGETRLQPVHRSDVARAIVELLGRNDVDECECGGPEVKPYRAFVEQIAAAAGIALHPLPVPFPAWHAVALLTERLPGAPLTRDQVALMRADKIAADGLTTLGIAPRSLDTALRGLSGTSPARG